MSNKSFCIICNSTQNTSLYPGVVECVNCHYIYADLTLTQEEFEQLYREGYFKGEEYSDYVSDKAITQINFNQRLNTLLPFIPNAKNARLLEVGSAYGFFLECAAPKFKEVVGVDVTEEGVKYANEVLKQKAYAIDLEKWDFENKKLDVACLWDTIEHLRRPDLYIQKISENMNTNGIIAITTGDIGSFVAKFRKNKWRLIHPPTHAHYFSKKSMTQLLEKNGFEVIHFEHCGLFRRIDLIAYNIFVLRWKLPFLYTILKKIGLTSLKVYFNLFDIMFVIARKK